MRISGTEHSSVIISQTMKFKKLKIDNPNVPKQADAKRIGVINPHNYNFNQFKYKDTSTKLYNHHCIGIWKPLNTNKLYIEVVAKISLTVGKSYVMCYSIFTKCHYIKLHIFFSRLGFDK